MASALLLLLLLVTPGSLGFQWTPSSLQSGAVVSVCEGQTVDLLWYYTEEAAEQDNDIEWTFRKQSLFANNQLATVFHGHFFTEPNIQQHVTFVPPSGLRLTGVTSQDAGTYTITVNINLYGSIVKHVSYVTLHVVEPFTLSNNVLHMGKVHDVVYDNQTGEYHAQLWCGTVTSAGNPDLDVIFKTPTHQVLNATTFEHGRYTAMLPNPVETGDYSCQISNPQDTCLPSNSPLLAPATLHVFGCASQLDVTSAELSDLKSEVASLRSENSYLRSDNSYLRSDLQRERQANYDCNQQLLQYTNGHSQQPYDYTQDHTQSYNHFTSDSSRVCYYGHYCDYSYHAYPSGEPMTTNDYYYWNHLNTPYPSDEPITTDSEYYWNHLNTPYPSEEPITTDGYNYWNHLTTPSSWYHGTTEYPSPFNTRELEVRLMGGPGCYEGRVEVRVSGCSDWGTVCDDSWTYNNGEVVCRQLGYRGVSNYLMHFPGGTGHIVLDEVRCHGTETTLGSCWHAGIGHHDCSHSEDVGISCY